MKLRGISRPLSCLILVAVATLGAGVLAAQSTVEPIIRTTTGINMVSVRYPTDNRTPVTGSPRVLLVVFPSKNIDPRREFEKDYVASRSRRNSYELEMVSEAGVRGTVWRFPPLGDAYREHPESHALWRQIAARTPDLLVLAGPVPDGLLGALAADPLLRSIPVQTTSDRAGVIKRIRVSRNAVSRSAGSSGAERSSRLARTPLEVARQLEPHYGHEFNEAVYIPAFALIARLRMGHLADVEKLAAPFVDRARSSLAKATGSHLAGHLLFAELAGRTGNPAYVALVKAASDLGFDSASGAPLASMPFHNQMSDAVFMGCPILVRSAKLTGDAKYNDMALRHYRFMRKLDLRGDGLWRHSPLDEAAWGRGNAFALLGLALALEDLPPDHPGYDEMLTDFRGHAAALVRYQTSDGMWRQIIDASESYREYSATAMIGTALLKGIGRGWLNANAYQPYVDKAWDGIKARTWPDGVLLDVCESTGAQKSREDYLNRKAIFGRDARGGAMGLLFATELAFGRESAAAR